MMYGKGLLARMGNGSVRRVKDQYEAQRIKRETGDADMFVFQDPGFNSEDEHKDERSGPVFAKPKLRTSLLNHREEDGGQGMMFGGSPGRQQEPPVQKLSSTPNSATRQPKTLAFQAKVAEPRKNKPRSAVLSGPVTGHAAASLNQDGSTKVRLLDQGTDPAKPMAVKKAAPARNSYQNARDMEAEAARMLEPGTFERIGQGLGELWRKAPAGMAEALGEGGDAAEKALHEAGKAMTSEEMRKGMEFGFRAAFEVMKEAGIRAGKDAIASAASLKIPFIPSTILGQLLAGTQAGDDLTGGFKELGQDVGSRIQDIKNKLYKE